jgi:DUF971 family protein
MSTDVNAELEATTPEHIAISKSKGIKIDWKDGHHSEFDLTYLRDECPCATCTGAHGTEPRPKESQAPAELFPMFKPAIKMVDVEPVGNYAIRIHWNDGHNSGIYSYALFRRICRCNDCVKA